MIVLQSYFHALVVTVAGALVAVMFVVDCFLDMCVLSHLNSDIWYSIAHPFLLSTPSY